MKVGELFVEIGITGGDKSAKDLSEISSGLTSATTAALKLAAAMAAAFYSFYKFGQQSSDVGMELTQFGNLTGLSEDKLQRWQQLLIHAGGSAQEMSEEVKHLQGVMTDMIVSGKAPQGIEAVKNVTGFDIRKARSTFEVLDALRDYARKTKDLPDVANLVLKSFVGSDKLVQALRTSDFDLNKADPGRLYSDKAAKRLAGIKTSWAELFDTIEHSMGRMSLKFSPTLLKDLTKLIPEVTKFIEALGDLALSLHLLQGVGAVTEGATGVLKYLTGTVKSIGGDATKGISQQPTAIHSTTTVHVDGTGMDEEKLGKHIAHHVNKTLGDHVNTAYRSKVNGGQ